MFTTHTWKSILLLLLFSCTFLVLMPSTSSYAGTSNKQAYHKALGEMSWQGSPLSPLISVLAEPDSAGAVSETETKAAVAPIDGPIIIGTEANQTSFVLLGAVLVGLIIVVGLVLGRRN